MSLSGGGRRPGHEEAQAVLRVDPREAGAETESPAHSQPQLAGHGSGPSGGKALTGGLGQDGQLHSRGWKTSLAHLSGGVFWLVILHNSSSVASSATVATMTPNFSI